MNEPRRLLLATGNAHKITEMLALLAGCGWNVQPAPPESVDVEETGTTFAENARIKALAVAQVTQSMALADDSGLVVDALNGAPGIYSHRWAGPSANDADRIDKLLSALEDVPDERRTARFICAACIAAPEGVLWEGTGTVEGRIASAPSGGGGFDYDPAFFLPEQGVTMAALSEAAKNTLSHRGRAMEMAKIWLKSHTVVETNDGADAPQHTKEIPT